MRMALHPEHGHASAGRLRQCLAEGTLAACDIVWAETRAIFPDDAAFSSAMKTLGVHYSPLNEKAASQAGIAWKAYRKGGGTRSRVMADFLIGSHALLQADRLLTRDRGYYRSYISSNARFRQR